MIAPRRRVAVLVAIVTTTVAGAACSSGGSDASARVTPSSAGATTSTASTSSTTTPAQCKDGRVAYQATTANPDTFTPVTPSTLTVVTNLPAPGFWNTAAAAKDQPTSGYEYDLANLLRTSFGLSTMTVRNKDFDSITAGTVSKYDVALSKIPITCDWAQRVSFSIPYLRSRQAALVRTAVGIPLMTFAQARRVQWGVQSATPGVDVLNAMQPKKAPTQYDELADAYAALRAGKIDAVMADASSNLGEASQSKGQLRVVAQFDQPGGADQYGAVLPKNSPNVGAVNSVLNQLIDSGQLHRLAVKDLGADPMNIPLIRLLPVPKP